MVVVRRGGGGDGVAPRPRAFAVVRSGAAEAEAPRRDLQMLHGTAAVPSWGAGVTLAWDGRSAVTVSVWAEAAEGGGGGSKTVCLGSVACSAMGLFAGCPERIELLLTTRLLVRFPVRHRDDGKCGCHGLTASDIPPTDFFAPFLDDNLDADGDSSGAWGGSGSSESDGGKADVVVARSRVERPLVDSNAVMASVVAMSRAPRVGAYCHWDTQVVELETGRVIAELYFWPEAHLVKPVRGQALKIARAEAAAEVAAAAAEAAAVFAEAEAKANAAAAIVAEAAEENAALELSCIQGAHSRGVSRKHARLEAEKVEAESAVRISENT